MKRRTLPALVLGASAALVVPLGVTASIAAWNDREWVHGSGIGTSSIDCGVDADFAAMASGRFLSGTLLGTDLDGIAALQPMDLARDSAGTLDVSPPDAVSLGSTPPTSTYADPLAISALGGIVGLDLTGLQVGLPVGSAGAVNQYAQVSGLGTAAGASGLVSDSGGVLVSADTPDDQLPEPATITLDTILPGVSGIAGVDLEVGAVAASAVLDGCAALRSAMWGDGTVTGVTRDYGVASLGLRLDSPLLGGLVRTVDGGVGTIGAAVDSLTGATGLLATSLRSGIQVALPGLLGVNAVQGRISITSLDLAGAVSGLLTTPLSDGVVSIDLASGAIDVDLAALLGGAPTGLNDLPPNTELVIDADVLNPVVARVGALLDAWTGQIVAALRTELREATLTVDVSTVVRILGGIDVLSVDLDLVAPLGAVLDGAPTAAVQVRAEVLGLISVVDGALALLGLPTVAQLVGTLLGLGTNLTLGLAGSVTTVALGALTTAGSTLAGLVTPILTALDGVFDALPGILSLMANVQPDRPDAPPGTGFVTGTDDATPQYSVTALRIGLLDTLGAAAVSFATASAGPVALP